MAGGLCINEADDGRGYAWKKTNCKVAFDPSRTSNQSGNLPMLQQAR